MSRSIPVRRFLLLLPGVLWPTRRVEASPDTVLAVRVDTTQRRALLHLPPSRRRAAVALVIAFHGAQGTGQGLRNGTGLNETADLRGVLVATRSAAGQLGGGLRLQQR
jgi:poly(3-hydroxybutyrate) depolymerase